MSSLYLKNWSVLWKTINSINDSKWRKRRLALSCSKKLSRLFREITLKHHGDFYCLNCLDSLRTGNKLKSLEKVCKNKIYCGIVMPSETDNIFQINLINIWIQIKYYILFMLILTL